MSRYVKSLPAIENRLRSFLERAPLEKSSLVLDGMGVNAAYQYAVLSYLGWDRLKALGSVNIISSSTYAILFYMAIQEGEALWGPDDMVDWDRLNRAHHGIVPGVTAMRLLGSKLLKRRFSIGTEGFVKSLEILVKPDFARRTVNDLPENFSIFLYNQTDKKIERVWPKKHPLGALRLNEIIQAVSNVPGLFTPFKFDGKRYSDPVYCKQARSMYRELRDESENYLLSNNFRDGESDQAIYLKSQPFKDGRIPMFKDFAFFLTGVPNPSIYEVAKVGLKEIEPLSKSVKSV